MWLLVFSLMLVNMLVNMLVSVLVSSASAAPDPDARLAFAHLKQATLDAMDDEGLRQGLSQKAQRMFAPI